MKFHDIKVGDIVITTRTLGVNYGWGQTAFARTFNLPTPVTKVTATEFTAGGGRYKKSGCKVGDAYIWARLPDDVKRTHTPEDVAAYKEKVRRLSGNISCTVDLNTTTDLDVAIKAFELIEQARRLLSGGAV